MNDNAPETPIVVNPSSIPEVATVIFRYAAALLSGWLIRRGVMTETDLPIIQGAVMAVAAAGFAIYGTISKKRKLVTVANAAPDSVAVVSKPTA